MVDILDGSNFVLAGVKLHKLLALNMLEGL